MCRVDQLQGWKVIHIDGAEYVALIDTNNL